MIINRDKLNLKGRSQELQDFGKLMNAYKKWHLEFCPKLQLDFAISKI